MEDEILRLQPLHDGLSEFNKWVEQHRFHGLQLHSSLAFMHNDQWKYGVGAHFTGHTLPKGTVVARIPKSFILSIRTVSSRKLRTALDLDNMTGIVGLTIAYLYESSMRENSPFHGYLSCFSFPDVPRLWGDNEKRLLKSTEIERSGGLSTVCRLLWVLW